MLNNKTADILETTLVGLAKRLEATTHNMANMNTPKYTRREISFEDQLKEVIDGPSKLALKTSEKGHIPNVITNAAEVDPKERAVSYEDYRFDENNVDPETEIARLTQTRMMYDIIAIRMGGKFRGMRRVLGGK